MFTKPDSPANLPAVACIPAFNICFPESCGYHSSPYPCKYQVNIHNSIRFLWHILHLTEKIRINLFRGLTGLSKGYPLISTIIYEHKIN
jgi:hypothetical protein